jgi:hypothetical protein
MKWDAGDLSLAQSILARCPREPRDWEWRYLDRLYNGSLLTFRPAATFLLRPSRTPSYHVRVIPLEHLP